MAGCSGNTVVPGEALDGVVVLRAVDDVVALAPFNKEVIRHVHRAIQHLPHRDFGTVDEDKPLDARADRIFRVCQFDVEHSTVSLGNAQKKFLPDILAAHLQVVGGDARPEGNRIRGDDARPP